ncbi:MAG: DUF1161 domain-containing protein [Terracidiphilus sp.]|jgi:hypothetical protein
MRIVASAALLFLAPVLLYGQGPKPCEELKSEIAKKLEANGARSHTLEIVAQDKDAEGKVVGSCEAGTKKIVYLKTPAPAKASGPAAGKH